MTIGLALADFSAIDNVTLEKMQRKGTPIIDIRTPQEWKETGIIKGSHKMMFFSERGEPDIANFMFNLGRLMKDKTKPVILYCAHANRSKDVGEWMSKNLGFKNVYELKGGIENGWIKAKKKVVK